jgi:serine/threonine protein phosphatase 1
VQFGDEDTLYIIGDLIDRGTEGIKVLQDVMARENVICLAGNHELMLLPAFEELSCSDKASQEEIIRDELAISHIGQDETLYDFCQLTRAEQNEIIDFIKWLPLYEEVTVNSQDYILVHGGLPDFDEVGDLDYYSVNELLLGPHDFTVDHFDDKIIIVGHLPTHFIPGSDSDEIFRSHDSIGIDCGLGFGGQLGVLCLDTGEEMYF